MMEPAARQHRVEVLAILAGIVGCIQGRDSDIQGDIALAEAYLEAAEESVGTDKELT